MPLTRRRNNELTAQLKAGFESRTAVMNRRQFLQATAAAAGAPLFAADEQAKAPFRVLYSNDTTNITSCVSPFHAEREPFRPADARGHCG